MKWILHQAWKASLLTSLLLTSVPCRVGWTADKLTPLDLTQVKVGGEIGRRIDVTMNNMLALDVDKDFLAPFLNKKAHAGYFGLGKMIDAAVKMAAYSGNEKMLTLKEHLVSTIVKAQEADGYIGQMAPADRMWAMWDIHETGYLIWGLLSDYHTFGERRSLEAARKAADTILDRWATMPEGWADRVKIAVHVGATGLERAMLDLYRTTADRRYLDFLLRERDLVNWDLPIVIGRRPLIEGHVYAYMTRCLAQLELYRHQPVRGSWARPARRSLS